MGKGKKKSLKDGSLKKMNKINRLLPKPPEEIKGFKLLKGEITRD